MTRIAIIGAGLSSAVLARYLDPAIEVEIFEKARGPGGRMSQRRNGERHFDHGAQHFTARGEAFQKFLAPLLQSGDLAEWRPRITTLEKGRKPYKRIWFEPHYVGVPGMNQPVRSLLAHSTVHYDFRVTALACKDKHWHLSQDNNDTTPAFDWVISTAPAPQSRELLPANFADAPELDRATLQGCFTLMLGLKKTVASRWDAAVVNDSPLSWIAMNNSKPCRHSTPAIVAHSSNQWAEEHIEADPSQVESILTNEILQLLDLPAETIEHSSLHRWLYAKVNCPASAPYCFDPIMRLAACGDWCIDGRVEAAFDSARQLAMRLNAYLPGLHNARPGLAGRNL